MCLVIVGMKMKIERVVIIIYKKPKIGKLKNVRLAFWDREREERKKIEIVKDDWFMGYGLFGW